MERKKRGEGGCGGGGRRGGAVDRHATEDTRGATASGRRGAYVPRDVTSPSARGEPAGTASARGEPAGTAASARGEPARTAAAVRSTIRVTSDEGKPRRADRKPNQHGAETCTPHEGTLTRPIATPGEARYRPGNRGYNGGQRDVHRQDPRGDWQQLRRHHRQGPSWRSPHHSRAAARDHDRWTELWKFVPSASARGQPRVKASRGSTVATRRR